MWSRKTRQSKLVASSCIILILCISLLSGCVQPEMYRVTNQRTQKQYVTITEALQQAEERDTLLLDPGIYKEIVEISLSITLRGSGINQTIIQGNYTGDVITVLTDAVTIMDCTLMGTGNQTYPTVDAGIDVQADDVIIRNVSIATGKYGLYSYGNHDLTLENINMKNTRERGFYLNTGYNISIQNCVVQNSTFGIYLHGVTDSTINHSQIMFHDETGLYVGAGSNENLLYGNSITDNKNGLHVKGAIDNTVRNNLILSNMNGLYLCCGAHDNLFYQNAFFFNDLHVKGDQVNTFDNGSVGNFWDDYEGVDVDGDGIGDTPYNVTMVSDYGTNNIDYFPLMKPV